YASIIDTRKPEREFDMTGIPVCNPHLMVSANVNHSPKKTKEFIHFRVKSSEYNAVTGSSNIKMEMIVLYASQSVRFKYLGLLGINIKTANNFLISGFIKFSDSGKILIEVTDIDYQKSSIYTPATSEISPDKSQKTRSIIDIIADDIESSSTQTTNCQFSSKTTFIFTKSDAKINLAPEQKNDSNLEAENDNEEQQNDSNLEAENDNEKQLNDNKEEKGSLTDENIKMTNVSEDEDQSKKRKTSVSEEEDQSKKRKKSVRTSKKEKERKQINKFKKSK
ncbi:26476_t:CDS:1, partial [Gigaspora margarita]